MAFESPLFQQKRFTDPAVFHPENLLREARRQKSLPDGSVPAVCVLDPDGDIVAPPPANRAGYARPGLGLLSFIPLSPIKWE